MYIDRDAAGRYILQDMSADDASALARMIRGASLEERRRFFGVLCELRKKGLI